MDKPKVLIEKHAWKKMYGWCKAAKSECSGIGLVRTDRNAFVVYDVFLPKQYCSSGYTELDDLALARLHYNLTVKQNKNPKHFRVWWHTHYDFNVFWSGTDDKNAVTMAKAINDWILSIVINQKGEYKCRMDFFKKLHPLITQSAYANVADIDLALTRDSVPHKRYRTFARDIRKYVKPLEELPERQKPKFERVDEYPMPKVYMESAGRVSNWERNTDVDSEWWGTSYLAEKERKSTESSSNLDGIQFGTKYVLYDGKLITKEKYDEMRAAPVKTLCKCGSATCTDNNECYPCTICAGNYNYVNGYCVGCISAYTGETYEGEIPQSGAVA